jgi:nitrogenase molybdenum-iron protein beta chain
MLDAPSYIERPRFSCALAGAMTTVSALPRGIPVLHAPPGCAGNAAWTQVGGGALQVGGYCATLAVPSSNVQEREVIFGGEGRLREELRHTFDVIDGDIYVVIPGCVPAMIGDDVKAVLTEFTEAGRPIVLADTGGFKGTSYLGYDLVLSALFRDYLRRDVAKVANRVNLWGIVPSWDVFWRGNLEALRTLLEGLGLEVNAFFTRADSAHGIREAAGAGLNVVVSDVYGVGAAEVFREEHGTDFVTLPMPIGPTASAEFTRAVGERLGIAEPTIAQAIARQNAVYFGYVDTLADCYSDMDLQRYAVVIGDANYAAAIPRFLVDDLGWLPQLVVHTDRLEETEKAALERRHARIAEPLRPKVVFETDTSRVGEHFRELLAPSGAGRYKHAFSPAFVIGSSLDRPFAAEIGAAHLSVSFPVANRVALDRGYAGISGGLRLVEDLLGTLVAGR